MVSDCDKVLATIIQEAISTISLIFNVSIVWITIKNRNLQNIYGVMLAIYSACEVTIQAYLFLPTILILTGTKISLLNCFYASAFTFLWAGMCSSFTLLFISLERLIAMLFPLFYQSFGSIKFIVTLYFISTAYTFTIIYFIWVYVLAHPDLSLYCELGDQFGDANVPSELQTWIFSTFTFLHASIFIIYIFLGIYLKLKKSTGSSHNQMAKQRRIFKSLAVIMCTILFTYFLGFFGVLFLVPLLTNFPLLACLYKTFSQLLILVGSAANAPVLYICSSEYRNAMNRHFPVILTILKVCRISPLNTNNVQVVQPMALATTKIPTSPAYIPPL